MSAATLLLADERGPALSEGLDPALLDQAPLPAGARHIPQLWGEDQSNDLRVQRWAVVYPAARPELLDAAAPLIARRAAQQGAAVLTRALEPADDGQALRQALYDGKLPYAEQPRYLLILGDLHEVSAEAQRRLGATAAVGRLAFDTADDYRAYAAKVARWEEQPAQETPELLLYGAHDPYDAAMRAGETDLLAEVDAAARAGTLPGLAAPCSFGRATQSALDGLRGLLSRAAEPRPGLLLSVTHGLGSARWSPAERRARQGAMRVSPSFAVEGDALRSRPFLPGGLWAFFACFGAGTPVESRYQIWLQDLADQGAIGGLPNVLGTLSTDRPFVSALVKGALANPDGPLGVLGHVDLAWGWSFRDEYAGGETRALRFANLLSSAARGDRFGLGLGPINRAAQGAGHLLLDYAARAQQGTLQPEDRRRRGHEWMTWNDLGAWVLLGDPAARLPTPVAPPPSYSELLGLPTRPAQPTAPPRPDLDTLEALVLAKIAGAPDARARAEAAGLSWEELRRLERVYMEAGRAAIARGR